MTMPTNVNTNNMFVSLVLSHIQHYNHNKYWKRRETCTSPLKTRFKLLEGYFADIQGAMFVVY